MKKEGFHMLEYIAKSNRKVDIVATMGEMAKEGEIILTILVVLGAEYEVVTFVTTKCVSSMTLFDLQGMLLDQDLHMGASIGIGGLTVQYGIRERCNCFICPETRIDV